MEIESSKLRANTGSVTGNLRSMPVGIEHAVDVDIFDAHRIRGLITQIHKSKSGHRFSTCQSDIGIKVWRVE